MTGSQIRRKFLDYFIQNGHKEVHSSSLVPANDPTLLFTNAGMNQFKDVFLGLEKRDYNRATTSQKCVRAGGKHNDLENVGFTNRHHTFFEMLGNFSFGDYFKKDAVRFAWELITSPQWYGISKDKLYVTIFKGENGVARDEEAFRYWHEDQGVPKERIYEFGAKDNFWQMGDTGPCGPCSEIHYDMGPTASGEGHTNCEFGCDCGRYVEIWNLVFMQFDRDASGTLTPLPKPSIDTGAGLERLTAVLQGKLSNYDTDLFVPLMKRAAELCGVQFEKEVKTESGRSGAASLRVIADHARAATFLISDGVLPSNEGRGYVLRKIMRRAMNHGRMLGAREPFLYQMVFAVRDLMATAYPELASTAEHVSKVVRSEEVRFARTVEQGLKEWDSLLQRKKTERILWELDEEKPASRQIFTEAFGLSLKRRDFSPLFEAVERELGPSRAQRIKGEWNTGEMRPVRIEGDEAFHLYDTFGLPLDFMQEMARDQGHDLDVAGFEQAMTEQRVRAQASWKGAAKQVANPVIVMLSEGKSPYKDSTGVVDIARLAPDLKFVGYKQLRTVTRVVAVLWPDPETGFDHTRVMTIPGKPFHIVLEHTPFYAASGGQVGDQGSLYSEDGKELLAEVTDTHAPVKGVNVSTVITRIEPGIQIGQIVTAVVDVDRRHQTMRHHTATHLLHAGLRRVLGTHVKQAGSLVSPGRLRFDFSHFTGVEDEELQDIEDIVNKEVLRNQKVDIIEDVPIDVAVNEYHAMALFGEKYGDKVRVIKIGDFSTELCGGTHTLATGEIGLIKVLDEGSVSSGVRRVEAVAGESSLKHFRADHQLEHVARKVVRWGEESEGSLATALQKELLTRDDEIKKLRKELEQARMKSASAAASSVEDKIREINGVKVLAHRADNLERSQLRTLVDNLRQKVGSGVVAVGSATEGQVALIVGVTKDLTGRVQAGKVIAQIAPKVGGKGGGRPDLAEGGGTNPAALDEALSATYEVVQAMLS